MKIAVVAAVVVAWGFLHRRFVFDVSYACCLFL